MKQIVLTVLLFVIAFNCIGQHKYIPFPDSNAVWVIKELDEFGNFERGYQRFIKGDTIINGKFYIKMLGAVDSTLPSTPQHVFYGIRNDTLNKRVYIYDTGNNTEILLYDFSLSIGDTIPLSWGGSAHYYLRIITDIKTISIQNNDYYLFEVDNNYVNPYIEGIGSLNGPFHQPFLFEGGTLLDCFMQGEILKPYFNPFGSECKLYHFTGISNSSPLDQEIEIFPNPTKGVFTLDLGSVHSEVEVKIFDLNGKMVSANGYRNISIIHEKIYGPPAIYFVTISTDQGESVSYKILKE